MPKLVSMKITPKEQKARMEGKPMEADAPMYPWGLEVQLDDSALEKLGIDVGDLAVGEYKLLIAKVEITSISSNESKGGGDNQRASLQIVECCLEDGDDAARVAKSLYDKTE